MTACEYPLFRERYLLGDSEGQEQPSTSEPVALLAGAIQRKAGPSKPLSVLDLRSLPRDDGPPSELRARKDKLAFFDRQCTRVADGLFVAGETVAKSRELLRASAITHVINCVGFLYPAYFEDDLNYRVLYLQDTPGEDILCVLYDVFDFIEEAEGGNVLVHCSQGVSRSTALAIAYLMWKTDSSYDDVFTQVKAHRGVANPNIGFICQLLQWHKRRHTSIDRCRMYRTVPQSQSAACYLVLKPVSNPHLNSLDPRGAFVVQGGSSVYVWEGARCPNEFSAAATRFAQQLVKYERAEGPVVIIKQGTEPSDFWECLAATSRTGDAVSPRENSSYDKDFELYQRAITGSGSGGGDSGDSARGGRKTPRDEVPDQGHSPNERLRKQARSNGDIVGSRGFEDVTTQELERGISIDSAAAQLEVKEQRVAPRPSRLQRTTSEEVSLPSLQRQSLGCELEDGEEATSIRGRENDLALTQPVPAKKPVMPPLKLKLNLPGR